MDSQEDAVERNLPYSEKTKIPSRGQAINNGDEKINNRHEKSQVDIRKMIMRNSARCNFKYTDMETFTKMKGKKFAHKNKSVVVDLDIVDFDLDINESDASSSYSKNGSSFNMDGISVDVPCLAEEASYSNLTKNVESSQRNTKTGYSSASEESSNKENLFGFYKFTGNMFICGNPDMSKENQRSVLALYSFSISDYNADVIRRSVDATNTSHRLTKIQLKKNKLILAVGRFSEELTKKDNNVCEVVTHGIILDIGKEDLICENGRSSKMYDSIQSLDGSSNFSSQEHGGCTFDQYTYMHMTIKNICNIIRLELTAS